MRRQRYSRRCTALGVETVARSCWEAIPQGELMASGFMFESCTWICWFSSKMKPRPVFVLDEADPCFGLFSYEDEEKNFIAFGIKGKSTITNYDVSWYLGRLRDRFPFKRENEVFSNLSWVAGLPKFLWEGIKKRGWHFLSLAWCQSVYWNRNLVQWDQWDHLTICLRCVFRLLSKFFMLTKPAPAVL